MAKEVEGHVVVVRDGGDIVEVWGPITQQWQAEEFADRLADKYLDTSTLVVSVELLLKAYHVGKVGNRIITWSLS